MKGWKDKLGDFFGAKEQLQENTVTQEQAQNAWDHFVTHQVLPAFQELKSLGEQFDGTTYDIQQAPAGERWVRLTWIVAPSSDVLAFGLSHRQTIDLPDVHIVLTYTMLSDKQSAQTTAWCETRIPNKAGDLTESNQVFLEVLGDYRSKNLTKKIIQRSINENHQRYVFKDPYATRSTSPLPVRKNMSIPIIPQSLQALNRQENQLIRTSAENQLIRTALLLCKTGRLEEALKAIETVIHLGRVDASAHKLQGTILNDLGRHQEALSALEQAIRLEPDDAETHNGRGIALRGLGQPEEALAAFEQALRLNPNDATALQGRRAVLSLLGRPEKESRGHSSQDRAETISPRFILALPQTLYQEMVSYVMNGYPLMACGMLGSKDGRVIKHYPVTNVAQNPKEFFEIGAEDMLKVSLDMEEYDGKPATYVSYPAMSTAYPSKSIIGTMQRLGSLQDGGWPFLIFSLKEYPEPPSCRLFTVDSAGSVTEGKLELI